MEGRHDRGGIPWDVFRIGLDLLMSFWTPLRRRIGTRTILQGVGKRVDEGGGKQAERISRDGGERNAQGQIMKGRDE